MSLIVADVGGTNARLAFQKNINSGISLIENFLCSDFKSLEDIIKTYKQKHNIFNEHISIAVAGPCLLYTSPSPRDGLLSRMPSSA